MQEGETTGGGGVHPEERHRELGERNALMRQELEWSEQRYSSAIATMKSKSRHLGSLSWGCTHFFAFR